MEIPGFHEELKKLVDSFSDQGDAKILEKLVSELKHFLHYMEKVDKSVVTKIIEDLESQSDDVLFIEVGRLLRRFHDQLVMIHEDIPENLGRLAAKDVTELSDRLEMIVAMTDKAANKTMDLAEELIDSLSVQSDSLSAIGDELKKLSDEGNLADPVVSTLKHISTQLMEMTGKNAALQDKLTEILVAQDYQDLTGQVIFKVINLLQKLEGDLAQLIQKFGQVVKDEQASDVAALKGPLREDDAEKSSQDDVDALLTKFGF